MQFTAPRLRTQITAIARAAGGMNRADRQVWESRLRLVYGEMDGQRGVDFSSFAADLDRHDTIIALESLYYLITTLISTSAFDDAPGTRLATTSRLEDVAFDRALADLIDGRAYEELGVAGCRDVYPLDWLCDPDRDLRDRLRELFRSVAQCWDDATGTLKLPGDDPFQAIHRQLFPGNLMHITGQFYSPEWLAEMLLDDVAWTPNQTLIDPFCGSGVFLSKALRIAADAGHCPAEVLPQLVGIDVNPFAAAATRANLALFVARNRQSKPGPIHLNVMCADAIYPSLRQATDGDHTEEEFDSVNELFAQARALGFDLRSWSPASRIDSASLAADRQPAARAEIEQRLTCHLRKADVVATNPPWVGWEYLSRPYRESIQDAWHVHNLFESKGLEAAFLKEDLSNLALLAAWDAYLDEGGRSVVVLRPSTMHSEVASRGVRRLSLRHNGTKLKLERIRSFEGLRLFKSANTSAATWMVRKGESTKFPVPVTDFQKIEAGWNPDPADRYADVIAQTNRVDKLAEPTEPDNASSRWMIATENEIDSLRRLRGSNSYTPRMGVFTGGANAVFYLRRASTGDGNRYLNITAGSKRKVPQVEVQLERSLVHSIARGRDIDMWHCRPEVFLLLPHNETTQMYPIAERELGEEYPDTHRYLCSMQATLQARNGFANWEKKIQRQHFYALQRVGAYTFAPYKVCWRYIACEFTICVLEHDDEGKVIVPNDKVMFIPFNDAGEAYFLAGYLSSQPVRQYVSCLIEKRQISTRVIKSLSIPEYDPSCQRQRSIAELCQQGHALLKEDPDADIADYQQQINERVEELLPQDCPQS